MFRLPKFEEQLHDLGCPICSGGQFALRRHPQSSHSEASCLQCGTVLHIDPDQTGQALPASWRDNLRHSGCIHCGSHLTRISFRCEIDPFTHFFVAICRNCSRSFSLDETRLDEAVAGTHKSL